MHDVLIFAFAWFVAGAINNLAGFGAAMVAMPIIATAIPLDVAVPSSTLIVLTLNVQLGWEYRQHMEWRTLRFLLLGGIVGIIAGLFVMRTVENETLKLTMGALLVGYGLISIFWSGKSQRRPVRKPWGVIAGFFSTFLGALFGFNGPPLAVFVSMGGWTQETAKGILSACFIVTGLIIAIGQLSAGIQTMQTLTYYAIGCPAVLLGGVLGIAISQYVSQAVYRKIILVLILTAGLSVTYSCI